jgi:hypothetical protein
MPINLITATPTEKTAILGALGLNELVTRTAAENLSNKILVSPAFSGTCTGQLDLSEQVPLTEYSVVNRSTLRRELMAQESAIQRFNVQRTYNTRGGSNADTQIAGSGNNVWIDALDRTSLSSNNNATGLDHTSWALKQFGTCYLSSASGSSLRWDLPFSCNFRVNHVETAQKLEYYIGICENWVAGVPSARGVGIFCDSGGFKLWSHNGSTYALTASNASPTLTYTGPPGAFPIGSRIRFSSMPSGTGLATNTTYFVVAASGNTFSVSSSLGGTAINVTAAIVITSDAQVMSLPKYSSTYLAGVTKEVQVNHNFLISSNGAGTASLYYSVAGNTIVSNTPLSTISIPTATTTNSGAFMAMSCTCKSLNSGTVTNSGMSVVTVSFAPFAV